MIPNSTIQKLCHISMSVWLITGERTDMASDALKLMQYFFLKSQLNIRYLVNNLVASLQLYLPTFMFVRTV